MILLMPVWVKIPLIALGVVVGGILLLIGLAVYGLNHWDYENGNRK